MLPAKTETRPFFVVGCGRSGSTLLQTLLDAHPNLAIPPETLVYSRFGNIFSFYGDLSLRANRGQLIRDLLDDAYFQMWGIDISVSDVENVVRSPTRAGVIEALFHLYAEKRGARRWGDKSPNHVHQLSLIKEDFPAAKLIHLVRDGRDVAEAWQRFPGGPTTALGIGRMWKRDVMAWRNYCDQTNSKDMLEVKYENLVTEPQQVLRRALDFLDERFVDTTNMYAESQLSKLYRKHEWHSSSRRSISDEKVGVYRKRLSRREVEIIENVAGGALLAYGYLLEYQDPKPPSLRDRLFSFIVDRFARWWRKLLEPKFMAWELQRRKREFLLPLKWMLGGGTSK